MTPIACKLQRFSMKMEFLNYEYRDVKLTLEIPSFPNLITP